jgi:hypothetical protein
VQNISLIAADVPGSVYHERQRKPCEAIEAAILAMDAIPVKWGDE